MRRFQISRNCCERRVLPSNRLLEPANCRHCARHADLLQKRSLALIFIFGAAPNTHLSALSTNQLRQPTTGLTKRLTALRGTTANVSALDRA